VHIVGLLEEIEKTTTIEFLVELNLIAATEE
jgi:hypothetical protein